MSLPQESLSNLSAPGDVRAFRPVVLFLLWMVALTTTFVMLWWSDITIDMKLRVISQVYKSGGTCHIESITPTWTINRLKYIPRGLMRIKGITWVRADDEDLASIEEHGLVLSHLEYMHLRHASLRDTGSDTAAQIERWKRCKVTDNGLLHIAKFTSLQELDLGRAEITDQGLSHLVTLTKLEYLDLSDTNISGSCFESLKDLPRLQSVVTGSSFDDQGLMALAAISSLRRVTCGNSKVTEQGVAEFKKLRPDCRVDR